MQKVITQSKEDNLIDNLKSYKGKYIRAIPELQRQFWNKLDSTLTPNDTILTTKLSVSRIIALDLLLGFLRIGTNLAIHSELQSDEVLVGGS